MAQLLKSSGRSIYQAFNLKHFYDSGAGGDVRPFLRSLTPANLRWKASNSLSAIQDTYLSTKEVFESHRVVFTIGTSIASVLTAWAGYSLRQYHQSNVERRLESIEKAVTKNYHVEREEMKKIVNADNVSAPACIATAGISLIVGYGLGWRGGVWYAKRSYKREQLRLMGQVKPRRGWKILANQFNRLKKAHPQ